MFPFRPRNPVSTSEKAWLDDRAHWLVQSLGQRRMLDASTVQPSDPLFELEDRRALFDHVARTMELNTQDDDIIFREQPAPVLPAELDDVLPEVFENTHGRRKFVVPVYYDSSALQVVASSARVIAQQLLLERQIVAVDAVDLGYIADLATVFYGFGICTANTVLVETAAALPVVDDATPWSMHRHGHMTMRMFGYALAWFANRRQELRPLWVKDLRPDVRQAFKMTMQYFRAV